MIEKLKKIGLGMLIASSLTGISQVQQTIDMSTGLTNPAPPTLPSLIAVGAADDTWTVKYPTGTSYVPVYCSNNTFICCNATTPTLWSSPQNNNVRMISPAVNSSGSSTALASGTYSYTMNFQHTSCSITSAQLNFTYIAADNYISSIRINNWIVYQGGYSGMAGDINFNPGVGNKIINVPVGSISQGNNTIVIELGNRDNAINGVIQQTVTGLLIQGGLKINHIPKSGLNATITTTKDKFCTYDAFVFNGTAALNSVSNHYWEMAECDQSGNVTPNGYVYSQWVQGNPGTYTFPTPPACGKYYKVKLAVQNPCVGWEETNKVVYYSCGPNVNAGPDRSICSGSCTTIGTTAAISNTYQWSNGITTAEQSVCPRATKVYTLTQTETSTGCTKADEITVTVYSNDPNFIRNTHADPLDNFYTVDCTPSDLNAGSAPGFGHIWVVEEVTQTGINPNTYAGVNGTNSFQGTNPNPCCWWPLATNYFGGYTGGANVNCSGTFPSCSASPGVGQFPLGKLYRITRGTWNAYCNWDQISYVVSQSGPLNRENGDTKGFTWVEDTNAPDMSYAKTAALSGNSLNADLQNISIFPNPTENKVTVLANKAIKSIRVTSINGALLLEKVNENEIDLSSFSSGMYFFTIHTESDVKIIKVIKE